MSRVRDITGERRGALVAISYHDTVSVGRVKKHRWLFSCDCGNEYIARKDSFLRGGHTSCGCKMLSKVVFGSKYEGWTVLSRVTNNGRTGYMCRCECGSESWVKHHDLVSGKSTKCIKCGYSKFESQNLGGSAMRQIYNNYKKNAISRGLPFELEFEHFCKLISSNCEYSGHPPMSVGRPPKRANGAYVSGAAILYNGVDRKNNEEGYTLENSVPCCAPCNRAKRAMPYDEWMNWLKNYHKLEYKR